MVIERASLPEGRLFDEKTLIADPPIHQRDFRKLRTGNYELQTPSHLFRLIVRGENGYLFRELPNGKAEFIDRIARPGKEIRLFEPQDDQIYIYEHLRYVSRWRYRRPCKPNW